MEYEEKENDGPHKNDLLLEWERRVEVFPMESLQYSQEQVERVHHRVQDIQFGVVSKTKEENEKVLN